MAIEKKLLKGCKRMYSKNLKYYEKRRYKHRTAGD